jgi:hypothetical protein
VGPLPSEALPVAANDYNGLVWLDDDLLITSGPRSAQGELFGEKAMVSMSLSGKSHQLLPIEPAGAPCEVSDDLRPRRLPDGRLGFIRFCRSPQDWKIYALDERSAELTLRSASGDPVIGEAHVGVDDFAYYSDAKPGLVWIGRGICRGIGVMKPEGVEPFDFQVEIDGEKVDLADYFSRPCAENVNADLPSWSPDGKRLAFQVAMGARGRDGQARLDASDDLLVHDFPTGATRRLLAGLESPGYPEWSPNGRWIAIAWEAGLGEHELWLVDTAEGRSVQLQVDPAIESVSWSPDGTRLAGLVTETRVTDLEYRARLVVIDMTSIVGAAVP